MWSGREKGEAAFSIVLTEREPGTGYRIPCHRIHKSDGKSLKNIAGGLSPPLCLLSEDEGFPKR